MVNQGVCTGAPKVQNLVKFVIFPQRVTVYTDQYTVVPLSYATFSPDRRLVDSGQSRRILAVFHPPSMTVFIN